MKEVLGEACSGEIGGESSRSETADPSAALSRLTGPTYGLSDIIRSGKTQEKKKVQGS